jgi:hypothetical protein
MSPGRFASDVAGLFGHPCRRSGPIDSLLKLLESIESSRRPELTPQYPAAFRYFCPPTAEDYSAKDLPLYDLSDYSKLLQQFLPADAASEARLGADRTTLEVLLIQHLKQGAARP